MTDLRTDCCGSHTARIEIVYGVDYCSNCDHDGYQLARKVNEARRVAGAMFDRTIKDRRDEFVKDAVLDEYTDLQVHDASRKRRIKALNVA